MVKNPALPEALLWTMSRGAQAFHVMHLGELSDMRKMLTKECFEAESAESQELTVSSPCARDAKANLAACVQSIPINPTFRHMLANVHGWSSASKSVQ